MRSSRRIALSLVTLATFTDVVAYSICVPVLPDFAHRLGASPTMIGMLFASFGVTLLAVSVPMGTVSDRIGRKGPLVLGMLALAGATLLFARAASLPILFAARMVQGAADGATWVVGLALIADRYGPSERGRVMGYVMSGTSFGIVLGPSLGGWLYEAGGVSLPFEFTSALALVCAVGFAAIPAGGRSGEVRPSAWSMVRVPPVAHCAAAVVLIGLTTAMLEPVLPLFFVTRLGLTPAQVGLLFGSAALASGAMAFVYGPLTDRWGGSRLTLIGLVITAAWLPAMTTASGFRSALPLIVVQWLAIGLVVTPSLAYMAEATAFAGAEAYGVGYGIYNTAWAIGLLLGPALGGWLFERTSLRALTVGWGAVILSFTLLLWRMQPSPQSASIPRRSQA